MPGLMPAHRMGQGMTNYTYTDIDTGGGEAPESVSFDLTIGGSIFRVVASREAIEDLAAASRVEVANLAGGLVEAARMFQPELAAAAIGKLHHGRTIYIRSEDVSRQ